MGELNELVFWKKKTLSKKLNWRQLPSVTENVIEEIAFQHNFIPDILCEVLPETEKCVGQIRT